MAVGKDYRLRLPHGGAMSFLSSVWLSLYPIRWILSLAVMLVWWLLRPAFRAFMSTAVWDIVLNFFTEHRGFIIITFVLPLSFVFDQFFVVRNWVVRTLLAQPKLHDERVRKVQERVREWNNNGRLKPMCTARLEWLTMSTRTASFKEDCSRISVDLHDILEVDEKRQIIRVEPLVDMGQITRHLVSRSLSCGIIPNFLLFAQLPMGWTLAVMVEMEDITVGGLLMGVGVENNSHIYGALSETVECYEVILGDGSVVRASRSENADLYHALPWSHGKYALRQYLCKPSSYLLLQVLWVFWSLLS